MSLALSSKVRPVTANLVNRGARPGRCIDKLLFKIFSSRTETDANIPGAGESYVLAKA